MHGGWEPPGCYVNSNCHSPSRWPLGSAWSAQHLNLELRRARWPG